MRRWVWGGLLLALVVMAGQASAQGTTTPGAAVEASTRDNITLGLAILGAITGVFGAGLSAFNTWSAASLRKVRVKVTPAYAMADDGSSAPFFSIGVTNLSAFAVAAEEVGFLMKDKKRAPIIRPQIIDGKPWPRSIGSREAASIYFDPAPYVKYGREIEYVYVRLASGEVIRGSSPALEQMVSLMRRFLNEEAASGR